MEDLVQVLSGLPVVSHPDLLVGTEAGDDAAVYRVNDDTALIFTVDFFPPITDNLYDYGAIAAANSLSDVYAMGGKPLLALNVVGFPADLAKDMLGEVLRGGYAKAAEAGCMIVGGHTVDDAEPKYGLAVVGTVKPGLQVSNSGAMPGDSLVLTKPLGTGIITTGAKQGTAPADILQAAVDSMSALNLSASEAMIAVGVNACTDISGYGLMGHLKGMVRGSNVGANIRSSRVPLLPGTKELLGQGAVPGGTQRNLQGVADSVNWQSDVTEDDQLLLCDAQTSGGLLISVPSQKTDELVSHLEAAGVAVAAVIGEITEGPKGKIQVSS
jgi:selenide,water dikinase